MTLSEFVGQGGVLMRVPEKSKFTNQLHPCGEVPEIIFQEAVLWMHKALHVLGASEVHIDQGLPSWSMFSAYQSAYFAARSILAFYGVSLGEYQHVSVVVDLCRDMRGMRPQKIADIGAFEKEIPFRSLGVLFDHRQTWQLFQRVLRISTCDIWPDGWASYFANLNMSELTRQRHGLHYHLDYWILEDLHDFIYSDIFNNVDPSGTGRELYNSDSDNFSLIAGYTMTKMALLLFKDLCPLTNRLAVEKETVMRSISFERHPLFSDKFQQELVLGA